jgi:hypothetical protein
LVIPSLFLGMRLIQFLVDVSCSVNDVIL